MRWYRQMMGAAAGLVAAGLIGAGPALAKQKQTERVVLPKNEIEARLSTDYVALPKVRIAIESSENEQYRAMDLEVWVQPADADSQQLVNSNKKAIMQAINEDFASYGWDAFRDATGGVDVAKKVVKDSVERACGAKLKAVLIKSLVLK